MNLKGTLPSLVLEIHAVETAHGYRIAQEIKQRSEGVLDFRSGLQRRTLYPALHKLESQGLVESKEEIGNRRPRRYYRITRPAAACSLKIAPNGGNCRAVSFSGKHRRFAGRQKQ